MVGLSGLTNFCTAGFVMLSDIRVTKVRRARRVRSVRSIGRVSRIGSVIRVRMVSR